MSSDAEPEASPAAVLASPDGDSGFLGLVRVAPSFCAIPQEQRRRRFTPDQLTLLRCVYEAGGKRPRTALILELAKLFSRSPRSVQIWFQNYRQKSREPRSPPEVRAASPPSPFIAHNPYHDRFTSVLRPSSAPACGVSTSRQTNAETPMDLRVQDAAETVVDMQAVADAPRPLDGVWDIGLFSEDDFLGTGQIFSENDSLSAAIPSLGTSLHWWAGPNGSITAAVGQLQSDIAPPGLGCAIRPGSRYDPGFSRRRCSLDESDVVFRVARL
ncbi:hypothetical protein HMN09_01245200 [Mycena chlorophos]|uniref:Homeobox domain-containing protein n=1 Tax=Mycena chlorophos TaxID=658473 RepID=A0A8H6VTN2_MYCCL|nr:hypothetical protein HMN09_01245200 [Mycena chlorophos]